MNEDEKKQDETEVTPEGAVEVKEEDLDQAAGGAVDAFRPTGDRLVENPTSPTLAPSDPSLKQSPTLSPTDRNWDMKQL